MENPPLNRKVLQKIGPVAAIAMLIVISMALGWFAREIGSFLNDSPTFALDELIAAGRSPNWKYGPGFYTAVVRAHRVEDGSFRGMCDVYVADTDYSEKIELGNAASFKDAFAKWHAITWTDDELIVGSDSAHAVRVKRAQIELHR